MFQGTDLGQDVPKMVDSKMFQNDGKEHLRPLRRFHSPP